MKRILPIILALAMLLLVLVSCGPKEEPVTTTEEVIAFCKGTMNFYVFSFP